MDIVVTIPKSEYANDDLETAVFAQGGYEQFWRLAKQPKELNVGDRVYFVKNGRIESSMRVLRIKRDAVNTCEVTKRTWRGCLIYMDDLQIESGLETKGFQGFRYRWW